VVSGIQKFRHEFEAKIVASRSVVSAYVPPTRAAATAA
jgi:hypothetical protein